jgi:hypothetical protein
VEDQPIINLYGISEEAFARAAKLLGCEVAAIKAVTEVEGAGQGMLANGKPRILFEPHIFWKQLSAKGIDPNQYAEKNSNILYPAWKAGNYGPSSGQHDKLAKAMAIDGEAALMSASWGVFQVMGFLYKESGFATVQEFANAMGKGEDEQLMAFARLLAATGLDDKIRQRDWAAFARQYNGPAYTKNKYDEKLKKAYLNHSKPARQQLVEQAEQFINQTRPKPKMKGSKG